MSSDFRRRTGAIRAEPPLPAARTGRRVGRTAEQERAATGRSADATAVPAGFSRLRFAEQFVVWSARRWVAGYHSDSLPCPVLGQGFLVAGLMPGLGPLYSLLTNLAAGGRGRLDFLSEQSRRIGADEEILLDLLGHAQSGDVAAARAILAGWMAPAAARLSEGPLHALAAALSRRGYRISRGARFPTVDPGVRAIH